jgi:hypothetical protein
MDDIVRQIQQIIKDKPHSYFHYLMSEKHKVFRDYILSKTFFLDNKFDIKHNKPFTNATRIAYCINQLTDFPKCCVCGNAIQRNITVFEDISKLHWCNKCAQKDVNIISKIKNTKLINHGDPNFNNMTKNICFSKTI